MKKWVSLALVACASLMIQDVFAQSIPLMSVIKVRENNVLLNSPGAGGLNIPQFSNIDLDQDGKQDLIVFDRAGKVFLPFVNQGTTGQVDYLYQPQYISKFPVHSEDFFLCRDFNCDGKMDLFYGTQNGVKVYENTSTAGNLTFQLTHDTLFTDYGSGPAMVFVNGGDVPDFIDVDGDGDLDMLTFDGGGSFVEWHKNTMVENQGTCAGIQLTLADGCWGKFEEGGLSNDISLGISCRRRPGFFWENDPNKVHAGSTVAAFDEEGDGDYELVLGDLLFNTLTYVRNGGTASSALMDTTFGLFPTYDASVDIPVFPAAFFLDINNDGKKDMLAAPNSINVSANYDNCWYYENIHAGNGVTLSRVKKTLLIDQMIDVGLGAYPTLFDHNNDGLLDLVIGNYSKKISVTNTTSGLVLYENIGTATDPEFSLVNRNYAGLNTLFNPAATGLAPTFGDLDGDGDKDLILGSTDGKVHYLENIAPIGQTANFSNLQAEFKGIDVGQFSAPLLVDIDRDGKLDLLIGEMGGTLRYYHNIGTAQVPDFASSPDDSKWGFVDTNPICCTGFSIPFIFENTLTNRYDLLVGSENGAILFFADIEPQYGDTFQITQQRFGDINEGQRTAITGADLNNDGIWDWLVGNVRGGIGFYSGNGPVVTALEPVDPIKLDWDIYPNPSNAQVTIRLNGNLSGAYSLKVFDLAGREMFASENRNAALETTLDFEALQNGSYLMQMELNGQFVGVKRMMIAR